MEFVVKAPEKIKVTNHDGKVYEINKPKFFQVEQLSAALSARESGASSDISLIKQYVLGLGLPAEVLEAWDIDTVLEFVEMVTGRKKK